MNLNSQKYFQRMARSRSSISGVALVVVLVMLTLMAILLIAFLTSASTELRSAKSYAVGFDARSLNDSAVNIVISQIQDATAAPTNAWASQPGMIKTYDTSGNLVTAYKLYSSNVLRTNAFNPVTSVATEVPPNWATLPDQYVDLNKPVIVSGVTNYPIIDPAAVATSQSTGPLVPATGAVNGSATALDGTTSPIQGCYIDGSDPDASNGALTTSSTQTNVLPMPVQWLYILQDGTIATINSAGVISNATAANPLVGRIAYWTDDESCKVNINTSGEGTFWGRPYTESTDIGSAVYTGYEHNVLNFTLPAQNEFQRFTGHPAMTSLSVIFPPATGQSAAAYNEALYSIIPRLAAGANTSESGTLHVSTGSIPVPNANHLFSSVDEFLFSAAASSPRTVNLNPNSQATTASAPTTPFTESSIEKTRFFLTANSRAPEVNMFNKPRITIWPLQANTANVSAPASATNRTAKDKLIAFCSTIGNIPYYFQRFNTYTTPARSGTSDYPTSLTQNNPPNNPIPSSQNPGLSSTSNLNYAYSDWGGIPRNQTLFAYLQYLSSNPIPGLGGSLAGTSGKYTTSVRDQILTEMVDFIRSEITTSSTGTTPSYFYAPSQASGNEVTGQNQVVPLVINPPVTPPYSSPNTAPTSYASYQTRGFGRFDTIKQAALVFYRINTPTISGSTTTQNPNPISSTSTTKPIEIGVVLLLDPWNATPGQRPWSSNVRITVSGLSGCRVNGSSSGSNTFSSTSTPSSTPPFTGINFADPATVLLTMEDNVINSTPIKGLEFISKYHPNNYKALGPTVVGGTTEEQFWPFYGQFALTAPPPANGTFTFWPPQSITIKIYPGYDPGVSASSLAAETPVQTITMNFPTSTSAFTGSTPLTKITLPIPLAMSTTYNNFSSRFTSGLDDAGHGTIALIQDNDVVRSIEARYRGPAMGDLRIPNALANVPQDYFNSFGAIGVPSGTTPGTTPGDVPAADDIPSPATGLTYLLNTTVTSPGPTTSSTITTGYNDINTFQNDHTMRMFPKGGTSDTGNGYGHYDGWINPYGLLVSPTYGRFKTSTGASKWDLNPDVPRGLTPTQVQLTGIDGNPHPGDWDTGPGDVPDGPYINKPDESNAADLDEYTEGSDLNSANLDANETGQSYSPNRQISSAVAFGSLPTGIDPKNPVNSGSLGTGPQSNGGIRPWQTLLFCPNPAAASTFSITLPATYTPAPKAGLSISLTGGPHPGFGQNPNGTVAYAPPYTLPPDHAFLDFFTMPIVEPYAISEPFSSAGKVNMNYQIVPFTYLTRDTAVRAVLKSVRMMAIPTIDPTSGQTSAGDSLITDTCYKVEKASPPDYRYTLNPDELQGTLNGFKLRFDTGDIFRSSSEICSLFLVPQFLVGSPTAGSGESISTTPLPTTGTTGATYANMPGVNGWWSKYTLTGDNVREDPYNQIYPRLTTKSNSYTVHVWTQTLKKVSPTANQFVDNVDQITSEYRGSYIVQRYLDPNSDSLISSDGSTPSETNPNSMVGPYKFRVVATKRFAP